MEFEPYREEWPVVEPRPGVVLGPPGDEVGPGARGRDEVDDDVTPPAGAQGHVALHVLEELDVPGVAVRHLDRRLGHRPTCKTA